MKANGSACIIIDANDSVLIARRAPGIGWMPGKWALPGGKLEPGETAKQAVVREVKEEMDLDLITVEELTGINYPIPVFWSDEWTGKVKINEEHTEFAWVPLKKLPEYDTVPHMVSFVRRALNVRKHR